MPQRGLITLAAYAVVFGTLVVQGITLGPLIRWLGPGDDGAIGEEVAKVRRVLAEQAIASLVHHEGEEAASIRLHLREIAEVAATATDPQDAGAIDRLWMEALREQGRAFEEMRRRGEVCEEAYRRVLAEYDRATVHHSSFKENMLRS